MEHAHILLSLTLIGVLGSLAQWLAWLVKLPAILFLLLVGLLLGPVTGWLRPDALFGELLFPIVSLAVAVILFEGSLTLQLRQIRGLESVVRNLVSIGALLTWGVIAVAAHWLLGLVWPLALLFGALVVVTGPTVIVPMLRTVRPTARVANVLRWEGIVIDPLGALLAVLVFEFILASATGAGAWQHVLAGFGRTLAVGGLLGAAAGHGLGLALRRVWVPEYLTNVVTLTAVFGVFTAANLVQAESGLLAVTVMGMWLANMKQVPVEEILDFKESLSVLLISGLFIILAARLEPAQLAVLGPPALALFAVIQFVARPLDVLVSTFGSSLNWRERALLAWIAPRGIIAAAVSALFALRLEQAGYAQAPLLVSLTFFVIITTVLLQSATARPLAHWLGVAEPEPRGLLIIGANQVARAIGLVLQEQGFPVMLTDNHWPNIRDARMAGLPVFYGQAISEIADRHLNLVGFGYMLGLSQNDHLNVLAALRYRHEFGRHNIYTLPPPQNGDAERRVATLETRGHLLFRADATWKRLASLLAQGAEIKVTPLTDSFTLEGYLASRQQRVIPMFAITPKGRLRIFSVDDTPKAGPGWKVIGLVEAVSGTDSEARPPNEEKAR